MRRTTEHLPPHPRVVLLFNCSFVRSRIEPEALPHAPWCPRGPCFFMTTFLLSVLSEFLRGTRFTITFVRVILFTNYWLAGVRVGLRLKMMLFRLITLLPRRVTEYIIYNYLVIIFSGQIFFTSKCMLWL